VAALGLVNGDLRPWDRDADHVTSLYPLKVGTNFADRRRSLRRYSPLADCDATESYLRAD
jgi:hypothetical protein